MADYRLKVINDGKQVIVKKQQVENIHGVPWRINTSKTVDNLKSRIREAMYDLDIKRESYYEMSLDELAELYPRQYEKHVMSLDKKSGGRRSYRLETLLPRYIEHLKIEGAKREQTIKQESDTLFRHMRLRNWAKKDIRTITARELDKLFLSLFKPDPSRARGTWKKDISRWTQFYDWIVRIDYLKNNPLREYKWTTPDELKIRQPDKPKRVYTDDMLTDLYWQLEDRPMDYQGKRALQLIIDTGLRISECLALTVEDIKNVAIYDDVINRSSIAYRRLESVSEKVRHVNFYHELLPVDGHDDYHEDDLLFFADLIDDIDSLLLVRKTLIGSTDDKGKPSIEVQNETKTKKGMRTVRLNKRARRTLKMLYRELMNDEASYNRDKLWAELGRRYLFIKPSGRFIVPNNLSQNLRYITKKMSEHDDKFFPITAHPLRHSRATVNIDTMPDYAELNRISQDLGHKNLLVTLNTYNHNKSASLLYETSDI